MSWALGTAVYFVIWWVFLFAVLPFGIHSQREVGNVVEGSDPGAPDRPRIGMRVLANTVVAAVVWGIVDLAYIHFYLQR
jgi:predicted secreted protein